MNECLFTIRINTLASLFCQGDQNRIRACRVQKVEVEEDEAAAHDAAEAPAGEAGALSRLCGYLGRVVEELRIDCMLVVVRLSLRARLL